MDLNFSEEEVKASQDVLILGANSPKVAPKAPKVELSFNKEEISKGTKDLEVKMERSPTNLSFDKEELKSSNNQLSLSSEKATPVDWLVQTYAQADSLFMKGGEFLWKRPQQAVVPLIKAFPLVPWALMGAEDKKAAESVLTSAVDKVEGVKRKAIARLPEGVMQEWFNVLDTSDWNEWTEARFPTWQEANQKISRDTNIFDPAHSLTRTIINGLTTHGPRAGALLIPGLGSVASLGFYEMEMEEVEVGIAGLIKKHKLTVSDEEIAPYVMYGGGLSGMLENLQYGTAAKQVTGKMTSKAFKRKMSKLIYGKASARLGAFLGSQAFSAVTEGAEEFGQEEVKLITLNAFIWEQNKKLAAEGKPEIPLISIAQMKKQGWEAFQEGLSMGIVMGGPSTVRGTYKEVMLQTKHGQRKEAQRKRKLLYQSDEQVRYVMEELNPKLEAQVEQEVRDLLEGMEEGDLFRKWRELQTALPVEKPTDAPLEADLNDYEGNTTKEQLVNAIMENSRSDDAWLARKQALLFKELEKDDRISVSDKFFAQMLAVENDELEIDRVLELKNVMEALVKSVTNERGQPKFRDLDDFIGTWITDGKDADKRMEFLQEGQSKYEEGTAAHAIFSIFQSREAYKKYRHSMNEVFSIDSKDVETPLQAAKGAMYQAATQFRQALVGDMRKQGLKINRDTLFMVRDMVKDMEDIDDATLDYLFEDDRIYKMLEKAGGEIDTTKDDLSHEETQFLDAFVELSNNFLYAYLSPSSGDRAVAGGGIAAIYGQDMLDVASFIQKNLPMIATGFNVKSALYEIKQEYQALLEKTEDPVIRKKLEEQIKFIDERFKKAAGDPLGFAQAEGATETAEPVTAYSAKAEIEKEAERLGLNYLENQVTPREEDLKNRTPQAEWTNPFEISYFELHFPKEEDPEGRGMVHISTELNDEGTIETVEEAFIRGVHTLGLENVSTIKATLDKIKDGGELGFNQEIEDKLLQKVKEASDRKMGEKEISKFAELDKVENPFDPGSLAYEILESSLSKEFMRIVKYGRTRVESTDVEAESEGARFWKYVNDIKTRAYPQLGETAAEVTDHEYNHAVQSKLEAKMFDMLKRGDVSYGALQKLVKLSLEYYAGDANSSIGGIKEFKKFLKDQKAKAKVEKGFYTTKQQYADNFLFIDRYLGELMSMYSANAFNSINLKHKPGTPEHAKLTEVANEEVRELFVELFGEDVAKSMDMVKEFAKTRTHATPQAQNAAKIQNKIAQQYNTLYTKLFNKYATVEKMDPEPKYRKTIDDVIKIEGFRKMPPRIVSEMTHTERTEYDRLLFLAESRYAEARTFLHDAHIKFYQKGDKLESGSTVIKGRTTFFSDMQAMVQFFKTADVSTIAHEFMHVLTPHLSFEQQEQLKNAFLNQYYKPNTPSFKTAKTALSNAVDMFLNDPTDIRLTSGMNRFFITTYMEYVARQFEAYLFQGKAPTAGLKRPMSIVADDMARIYNNIASIPLVAGDISPMVRRTFDQMLAGDKFINRPTPKKITMGGQEYTIFVDKGSDMKIRKLLKKLAEGLADIEGIHDQLWNYAEKNLGDIQLYTQKRKKNVRSDKKIHDLITGVDSYDAAVTAVKKLDQMRFVIEHQYHNELVQEIQGILKDVDWQKSDKTFVLRLKNAIMDVDFKLMKPKKLSELTGMKEWLRNNIQKNIIDEDMMEIAVEKLAELDRLSKKNIYDFTLAELQELRDAMQLIIKIEGKKQSLRIGRRLANLEQDKESLINYLQKVPDQKNKETESSQLTESMSRLAKIAVQSGIQPHRMLMVMSGFDTNNPLWKVVDYLRTGESIVFARDQADTKFFRDLLNPIEGAENWSRSFTGKNIDPNAISTYQLTGEDGKVTTIELTKGERITLYLYSKNKNATRHLLGGGIVLAKNRDRGEVTKLNQRDLAHITGTMSTNEIYVADKIEGYYRDVVAPAINQVSRQLVGYDIATEDNYLPLFAFGGGRKDFEVFNKPALSKSMNQFKKQLIDRMNFLRERKKSSSPIHMYDVFEITQMNLKDVNRYVGLALPLQYAKTMILDSKVTDETGVYYGIVRKFGKVKADNIVRWLEDIEDPSTRSSAVGRLAKFAKRATVAAQLGYNVSVSLIQRLSAGLMMNYGISPASFAQATKRNYSVTTGYGLTYNHSMQEMADAIPEIAQRFEVGPNIDVEELFLSSATRHMWMQPTTIASDVSSAKNFNDVSQIVNRVSVTGAMQWIKENDAHALSTIYDAVLIEGEKQGWDEDQRKEKFLEILYNTQPNYNTINLSEVLRTKNVFEKILFGTYQTMFNQIFNEIHYHAQLFNKEYGEAKTKRERATAAAKLGLKYANIYLWTNLFVSLVKEAVGGSSDEPEEFAKNVATRTLINTFVPIPYVGPVMAELIASAIDKRSVYSSFDPPGNFLWAYGIGLTDELKATFESLSDEEYAEASYHLLRVTTKALAGTKGFAWDNVIAQSERWLKRLDIVD